MKTQTTASDIFSENLNISTKMFVETTNALADIYSKQFQLGTNILNKFLHFGSDAEKTKPIFNTDLFHSAFEIMKRNLEEMLEISKKNVPVMMNVFRSPLTKENGHSTTEPISETVLKAYHLQAQQMTDANKWFLKTFTDTFNITNGEQDRLFKIFQKNSEKNFRMAEDGIQKALKTYSSITEKSAKEMHELVDTITEQMQFLSDNNMKDIWSTLLHIPEKESNGVESKRKEKVKR